MNIKEYIASGILEQYVLGQLSDNERREVEQYASAHPEIKAELEAIEGAFEVLAQATAIQPDPGLEAKIMEKIKDKPGAGQPADPVSPPPSTPVFKIVSALAMAATVAAVVWGWSLMQQRNENRQALQDLQAQYEELENNCAEQSLQNENARAIIAFLRDDNTSPVEMKGTEKAPDALATVYWNGEQKKSYLDITNMPQTPAGKQYQLWAIVDGAPVDMGVFEEVAGLDGIIEVPFIENPQAFAVTLEQEGGSPVPTLEEMVVIGNVG